MKVGVVIPYRETPTRKKALQVVLKWYEDNYPNFEIFYADKPGEWQHSGTRNLAVKIAEENNLDVVILNDADTIPEKDGLDRSISGAMNDLFIHNPYTMCHYLTKEQTKKVIKDMSLNSFNDLTQQTNWVCGGIFVFRPEAWWKLGGMDEKIISGPEDFALQRVHEIVNGCKILKHSGSIYCLWHERIEKETKEDWEREEYNQSLYQEYLNASTPEGVLSIVLRKN